jgi:glycosyltransferase involved in cell wall biosynthesis
MAAFWAARSGFDLTVLSQGAYSNRTIASPLAELHVQGVAPDGIRFQIGLIARLLNCRLGSRDCIFYVHGHVCTPAAWITLAGLDSRRIIYHTQDYLEPGRHRHWEFFERRFARRAGEVISNEPNRARFMMSHYGLKNFPTVVPTLLPKGWPRPERSDATRDKLLRLFGPCKIDAPVLIMHQGSFAPLRCGESLVRALALLPQNYLLVFTGMPADSEATRRLRVFAGSLGVAQRVTALDRLAFETMQQHSAACDLGLLLYPNDGIGNFYQAPGRLTEYLSCGLPVVTSNFPGLELLVLKHQLGTVADPQSPESISAAIRLIGDQGANNLRAWRQKLRELSLNELCYDRYAGRIDAAIRRAVAGSTT